MERVATDTGAPVRSAPLPGGYPGATAIDGDEVAAVREVLERRSPFRYYGPEVAGAAEALERAFAARLGVAHALGVSSGTAALIVALRALGVGPGDEVILPPATFVGCANAVVAAGAVPVFADVDDDLQISPAGIEGCITPRTKAIMAVHWRGLAVPLRPILEVANAHGVPVVEDCAQSLGARDGGFEVGARGRINAFSFQMNKVLTAGEGGMVATGDPDLAARAIALHDNGSARKESVGFAAGAGRPTDSEAEGGDGPKAEPEATVLGRKGNGLVPETTELFGENYRLTEVAAAIMRVQLGKLDRVRQRLRKVCDILGAAVDACDGVRQRRRAGSDADVGASAILIFDTAELAATAKEALAAEGVPLSTPYGGRPIYLRDVFQQRRLWHAGAGPWDPRIYDGDVSYAPGTCPTAEEILPRVGEYTLSLDWSERDAHEVAAAVTKVMGRLG